MANPVARMNWLVNAAGRLSSLATGETPLSHEGIDSLGGPQAREHLRELLMDTGMLPVRDKYLAAFDAWRQKRLASIDDPAVRKEIQLYLAWRQMRDLSVRAEAGKLKATAANLARDNTDAGVRFLAFLSARERPLSQTRQEDVDDWFAHASNPFGASDFLKWAICTRRCPRLELPRRRPPQSKGCPPEEVAGLVRRLLSDEAIALGDRTAGLLVLLFAQPVTRIIDLKLGDLGEHGGELTIRLGDQPVVVPSPAAAIFTSYAAKRWNMTSVNPGTDWLFPGRRPGEHVTALALRLRLNQLGIGKSARVGALDYLLAEIPSAVVASVTGYNANTTATRVAVTGNDWAGYVALKRQVR